MKLNNTKETLWGQESIVTPYLVDEIYGDGQQYLALWPIFYRPNYYVVRVDSKWPSEEDNDNDLDLIEEVWNAIEEQFGTCCEEQSESGGCDCCGFKAWPALKEPGGWTWGQIYQSGIDELFNGLYSNLFIDPLPEPTEKHCSYCTRDKYLGKGEFVKDKHKDGQPYAYWRYRCRYCQAKITRQFRETIRKIGESMEG